jgi:hypothetical protein
MNIVLRLVLSFIFVASVILQAKAGAPISFIGYSQTSRPIFSKAGPTIINYQLYAQYDGIQKPGGGLNDEGLVIVQIRDLKGNLVYTYAPEPLPGGFGSGTTELGPYVAAKGSFQFSNAFDQNLIIEEQIWWTRPLEGLSGFPSQEWKEARGQSLVSGGDNPIPAKPNPPPIVIPPPTSNSIRAVIISGLSDPAKVITSGNATLTGGVVALGKNPSPPAAPNTRWSTGLRIVPDQALLTGAKIPHLTPNIIDVRIVKHEVSGDLSTTAP